MNIEEAYQYYYPKMLNFACSYVKDVEIAHDIVQGVWLKIFEKNSFKDIEHIKSYLFQATKNQSFNHLRSRKNKSHLHEPLNDYTFYGEQDPFEDIVTNQEFNASINLLMDLPTKQKTACYGRLVLQKSLRDIANENNINYDTVKANYRHGVLKIRETLREA